MVKHEKSLPVTLGVGTVAALQEEEQATHQQGQRNLLA